MLSAAITTANLRKQAQKVAEKKKQIRLKIVDLEMHHVRPLLFLFVRCPDGGLGFFVTPTINKSEILNIKCIFAGRYNAIGVDNFLDCFADFIAAGLQTPELF